MKKHVLLPVSLPAWALAVSGALGFAAPSAAHAACNNGYVLSGYYGLQVNGATPVSVGKFLNGVVYFNGTCLFNGTLTIGEGGTVNSFASVSGSYNPNSDGTITLNLSLPGGAAPETYQVSVAPHFAEALGIETDGSAVASIDIKAQNYPPFGPHNVYNNYLLKGTWAANCSGQSGTYSDLNYFTFDGYGNITGVDIFNNYASYGDLPYTGLYNVGSGGNFGGQVLVGGSVAFGFSGVIDNSLQEIQFVYSTAGSTGSDIVACTGKRV